MRGRERSREAGRDAKGRSRSLVRRSPVRGGRLRGRGGAGAGHRIAGKNRSFALNRTDKEFCCW